jgi:hypothetical protein
MRTQAKGPHIHRGAGRHLPRQLVIKLGVARPNRKPRIERQANVDNLAMTIVIGEHESLFTVSERERRESGGRLKMNHLKAAEDRDSDSSFILPSPSFRFCAARIGTLWLRAIRLPGCGSRKKMHSGRSR